MALPLGEDAAPAQRQDFITVHGEGYDARVDDVPSWGSPYEGGSADEEAWTKGWEAADAAIRAERAEQDAPDVLAAEDEAA
jgi:hypothetical protein